MNAFDVREICLKLPGATEQIQWEKDLLLKVGGKMFVCMGMDPESGYSFKSVPEGFAELIELPGIEPAPYLARAKWVRIDPAECTLDARRIAELIRQSYDLVFAKLPKKLQREIRDSTAG